MNEFDFGILLKGICFNKPSPHADLPFDVDYIFELIKDNYYKNKDFTIWEVYRKSVIRLSQDLNYSWLSLYYVDSFLRFQSRERIIFFDTKIWIHEIYESLRHFKNVLMNDKRWVGVQWENGLWGDVERMTNLMNQVFNLKINLN